MGAYVFPQRKAPEKPTGEKKDSPHGVWKYKNEDKRPKDEDDWEPQKVWIYPLDQEPESPVGTWGLAKDAKPDDNGDFKTDDIHFYGPDETPDGDDDFVKCGTWTPSPGTLNFEWPPKAADVSKKDLKTGKLPKKEIKSPKPVTPKKKKGTSMGFASPGGDSTSSYTKGDKIMSPRHKMPETTPLETPKSAGKKKKRASDLSGWKSPFDRK